MQTTTVGPARSWMPVLAQYRDPSLRRSLFEIAVTAGPFAMISVAASVLVARGQWWALALALPAAVFLVRLFLLQHDCGHGSLFRNRRLNDWVGRAIGVLTFTPYDYWKKTHAIHHGNSGALDRRDLGSLELLTVDEYRALPPFKRLMYRLYRHPAVLFGVGPAYMFVLQHRLPIGLMKDGARPWLSAMFTNLAIGLIVAGLWVATGSPAFILVHLVALVAAATMGVWLFFVQHQFENTSWDRDEDWDLHEAALHGSSHYDLPPVLRWLTANIGIHHIHHLNSRIPFYRLSTILRRHPELKAVSRVTLLQSLRCASLALWHEQSRRLVSFREARAAG
ncbi:MAG: fatty acid desaturase [Caulobacteraceae bacterium]